MRDIEFDEPVGLMTAEPGKGAEVRTAGQAARWLLEKWPAKAGPKHRAARQALVDLLEGRGSPAAAREAFEQAADEAEIRIGGWHRKNPVAMFLAKNHGLPMVGATVPRPKRK